MTKAVRYVIVVYSVLQAVRNGKLAYAGLKTKGLSVFWPTVKCATWIYVARYICPASLESRVKPLMDKISRDMTKALQQAKSLWDA